MKMLVIDPDQVVDEVRIRFDAYSNELRDPKNPNSMRLPANGQERGHLTKPSNPIDPGKLTDKPIKTAG